MDVMQHSIFVDKKVITKNYHGISRPFVCDWTGCDATFPTQNRLNYHTKHCHINKGKFKCTLCTKSFNTQLHLECHIRRHTGEKAFQCNICDKRFVTKTDLAIHKNIHSNDKPYKCNICQKGFCTSTQLKHHAWRHTGIKPFGCKKCGTRYTQRVV